ncbi:MAG: hypothetical protein E7342_00340 [Clostridiales bacterium]|nr:hypothetical protein [Clostridiales bacterium]
MKIKRFIGIFLCLLTVGFNFLVINKIEKKEMVKEEKIMLTIWQIDTFPGGKGSRADFLKGNATLFEKKENILISVLSYSLETANNLIEEGVFPDIISYGNGLKVENLSKIEKDFSVGKINKTQYAIPWARSKYYIIYKGELDLNNLENLVVLDSENTLPLMSLLKENIYPKNLTFTSSEKGIRDFINGKINFVLGTNRDIIRLENKFVEYNLYPLNSFSDLYQYFSIVTKNEQKISCINRFIEHMTSKKVQENLTKLSLFSPYFDIPLEEENLRINQSKPTFSINPFYSNKRLNEIKNLAKLAVGGDNTAKLKLEENYYCKI